MAILAFIKSAQDPDISIKELMQYKPADISTREFRRYLPQYIKFYNLAKDIRLFFQKNPQYYTPSLLPGRIEYLTTRKNLLQTFINEALKNKKVKIKDILEGIKFYKNYLKKLQSSEYLNKLLQGPELPRYYHVPQIVYPPQYLLLF